MKSALLYILMFCLLALLSCTNINNKDTSDYIISDEELKKQINVQNFFNTIPSSTEVFQIIRESKLNYNPDILNNPVQHKNYTLEKSQVLNLGVYGADLAISGAFNQAQESMLFLKCANYLAKELGISTAFDEGIMDRLEANKENRDSTLEIISQAFKRADRIFTENKRGELSVLMITGAFVEAMYVAGAYAFNQSEDTVTFNKIRTLYIKQQESLSYLINLLKNLLDKDNQNLTETLININNHLKAEQQNKENFKKAHGLFSALRKQIVSVY